MLDTKAVADLLGLTVQHTRWLFRRGIVPATKLGRDWFTCREDVAPYVAQRELGERRRQLQLPDDAAAAGAPRKAGVPSQGEAAVSAVNVAQVPQLSPFRYPGGKTWLIPYIRRWLGQQPSPAIELVDPFAGGGIVSLTAVFEGLVERATLVELDEDVAAVWLTILNGHGPWLAGCIRKFSPTTDSVGRALANGNRSLEHRAFAGIVKNRVTRGGILAPGAGFVKLGENGKGLASRWYPHTLSRRVLQIVGRRDRLHFIHGDGMKVLRQYSARAGVVYFIDPPYTVAGRRLYKHCDIDHEALFVLASRLKGDFLMTYDNAEEVRTLAGKYRFPTRAIEMKTTHHRQKTELLIGRSLGWLGG